MEGLTNLAIYFILSYCEFTAISAGSVEGVTNESPKTDCNDVMVSLKQGSLVGNITASKDGANLKFKIKSKIVWNDTKGKCKDSGGSSAVREESTTKGDKGDIGPIGLCGMKESDDVKGMKGDKGPIGPPGQKGMKGDKGPIGPSGQKGDKGDIGPIGFLGRKGSDGVKGVKGDEGRDGEPGMNGMPGPRGDRGEKGDSGPPGPPGKNGKSYEGLSEAESEDRHEGSESKPADTCSSISDNGFFYINPANKFEVECKEYHTCIKIPEGFNTSTFSTSAYEFKDKKGFWLSGLGFDANTFYQQSFSNILYLMTKSERFELTMTYHCYNSPVESLKILSWNGNTIDNIHTKGPIHFQLPEGQNECKNAKKDELKSSVIKIESHISSYLPVDFFIGDIEVNVQKVYIQLTSLCFK